MSKPRVTTEIIPADIDTFGYQFADGFKWASQMSREELLLVIQTLILERKNARKAALDALELARLGARI